MRVRSFIVTALILGAGVSVCAAVPDPASPFGVVCPWEGLKDTGIGWVRCGAGATALGNWCDIEKKKDIYDWERSDAELKADVMQGLIPLPILGYTPAWASSGTKGESSSPPKDLSDYASFVTAIVSRYSGDISCWEIWNEPDIGSWTGSISRYTDLLKTAYTAAKVADPSCSVVFGGTAGVDLDFIRRVYEFGGRDYFDVMAVHPYQWGDTFNDGWFTSQLVDLRKLMNSQGDSNKEIWLTELGWSTGDKGITDDVQARLLAQAMVTARTLESLGVTRAFWFCAKDWGKPGYGIIRDNGERKPAFQAYATLTKVLMGAHYVGKLPLDDSVRCHVFRRSTGAVIIALWASERTRISIPAPSASSQTECLDYLGKRVQLRRANGDYLVWAQPKPLYIVRADTSVLRKLVRPAFPPFVPRESRSVEPPSVWASIVCPDGTSRPYLAAGSTVKLRVVIQNQMDQAVKGRLYLKVEGVPTPKPLDYKFQGLGTKVQAFTVSVPASGRRGLVQAVLNGTANGEKLTPLKTTIRISGGPVIEFLANSATEKRYLFKDEGSGASPSVRFNGSWTYKFDLTKAKHARVEMNVGANNAGEWRVLASNDKKNWKTVVQGESDRSWQEVRLDEFAGKPLYLKFEGNDQQLEELVLFIGT